MRARTKCPYCPGVLTNVSYEKKRLHKNYCFGVGGYRAAHDNPGIGSRKGRGGRAERARDNGLDRPRHAGNSQHSKFLRRQESPDCWALRRKQYRRPAILRVRKQRNQGLAERPQTIWNGYPDVRRLPRTARAQRCRCCNDGSPRPLACDCWDCVRKRRQGRIRRKTPHPHNTRGQSSPRYRSKFWAHLADRLMAEVTARLCPRRRDSPQRIPRAHFENKNRASVELQGRSSPARSRP